MKVIYKKGIMAQIHEAIQAARTQGKELEQIVLSEKEWDEFSEEHSMPTWVSAEAEVGGVLVTKEVVDKSVILFVLRTQEEVLKAYGKARGSSTHLYGAMTNDINKTIEFLNGTVHRYVRLKWQEDLDNLKGVKAANIIIDLAVDTDLANKLMAQCLSKNIMVN